MTQYRYGLTLRPLSQLNLNRLGYVDGSYQPTPENRAHPFGTAAFSRRLTPFEESQLDLPFLGEEENRLEPL